jgi:UDPglucose 6-dehydrogenase
MAAARPLLPEVALCADAYEAAVGADAVALVTEWAEFARLDLSRVRDGMRRPVLVDGRNLYDPGDVRALGFTYRGIGRDRRQRRRDQPLLWQHDAAAD